tara:strand:- start:152 stop:271 length:120 start_codon:yes stop_codon:yes gene_type:complete
MLAATVKDGMIPEYQKHHDNIFPKVAAGLTDVRVTPLFL